VSAVPNPHGRLRVRARIAGLYAITPDLADGGLLVALVDAAIDGGATVVQYRHKTADAATRTAQASALAALCRERSVPFIVNDHAELALAIDGAGLHVGADDVDDAGQAALRARLGPDRLLGVSCYADAGRARIAVAAGADYVAFGSVFPSSTKPAARSAALALFADAGALGVPLVGIGGISPGNLPALVAAGADAAAVISALFGSLDPAVVRRQARAFAGAFAAHST
jgi:thiamine-phosphate pyrophosphorylase